MCTFRLLLLLAVSLTPECAALPLVATPSRRAALTAAAAAVLTRPVPRCWAATLEEEDDAEVDEVPLLKSTSGMKCRAPPGEASRATYSKAEGSKAFAQIVACRAGVATVDKLLRAGDFSGATTLLAQPPFSSFKQSALVLVNSKVLSMEDIKAIGTEKRFGVGADVIIMLGGLADATERSDRGAGLDYASKAAASLDEITAIGRSNGL